MEITAKNVPDALYEVGQRFKVAGVRENSRNGEVLTITEPVMLTILSPTERVLTCPKRDANPFFHIAETVWMLGGGQGLEFVENYNSGMARYSDDGATLHGAYGHRWRKHFYRDQIVDVINHLWEDPESRRAIIAMWDAEVDHKGQLDVPCNTHIAFRIVNGALDATVFNRSNDVLWGMLGANAVHMTYLHELIALALGRPVGRYRVLSSNAHCYLANPQTEAMLGLTGPVDTYGHRKATPLPLGHSVKCTTQLLEACKQAVAFPWQKSYASTWMNQVYVPMRNAYFARKDGEEYGSFLNQIEATDWRMACTDWCFRRDGSDN